MYSAFASEYGFKYIGSASSVAETTLHLQNGGAAIISVPGHLMALVDHDSSNGKYLILDSYKSSNRGTYSTGYRWLYASDFTGNLAVCDIRLLSPNNSICSFSVNIINEQIIRGVNHDRIINAADALDTLKVVVKLKQSEIYTN